MDKVEKPKVLVKWSCKPTLNVSTISDREEIQYRLVTWVEHRKNSRAHPAETYICYSEEYLTTNKLGEELWVPCDTQNDGDTINPRHLHLIMQLVKQ